MKYQVHTNLKGFARNESFLSNLDGFFNFGEKPLNDHQVRLIVNYGIEKEYRTEADIPTDEAQRLLDKHANDKILILPIKKEWFDKIKSGEKTEEYREIKPYWIKRLVNQDADSGFIGCDEHGNNSTIFGTLEYIPYSHVLFINGRTNKYPRIEKELVSITVGKPQKGLCPDEFLDKDYFIIKFK